MSLFLFLTVVQAIVAAALVGVILMQRSEGGGLGIGGGGSPGGLMSARGAADFLTRSTRWLAIAFVVLSIALAAVAVETSGTDSIESTLDRSTPAAQPDPLAAPAAGAAGAETAPAEAPAESADPLAGAAE
ncbi:MAG: preprotein translocase subunit SecG [Sphingomonadaceae bacterium]|nr:preprotein translocase subunit SecG [Sphingomonadaceae bacterium]